MRRTIFDVKQCMSPKATLQILTSIGKPERLNFERLNRMFGWEELTFSPTEVTCLYTNNNEYYCCQFLSHAYDE